MLESDVEDAKAPLFWREEVAHESSVSIRVVQDPRDALRRILKQPMFEVNLAVERFHGLKGSQDVSDTARRDRSRKGLVVPSTVMRKEVLPQVTSQSEDVPQERHDLIESQGRRR